MEVSLTLTELVSICAAIAAIAGAYKIVKKPWEDRKKHDDKIDELLENDKKRLDKLDDAIEDVKKIMKANSDMIYQMLDHMATNNNSGGMKKALDKYNQIFRNDL